jgi:hypothetical protein
MANDHEMSGPIASTVARNPRTTSGRVPALWTMSSQGWIEPVQAEAIFELLVAVMWSDGELATAEVERGRAAAEVMHVRPRLGGAFTAMADGPLPFGQIAIDALSGPERRVAFAAAEWVADAAPGPSDRRSGFVRALQMRLAIDDEDARYLGELALSLGRECEDPRQGFGVLMRSVLRPLADDDAPG